MSGAQFLQVHDEGSLGYWFPELSKNIEYIHCIVITQQGRLSVTKHWQASGDPLEMSVALKISDLEWKVFYVGIGEAVMQLYFLRLSLRLVCTGLDIVFVYTC